MDRPTSVTVIAILQIIGSVIGIGFSLLFLVGGALIGGLGGTAETGAVGGFIAIFALLVLILSTAALVLAIGLLQLKGWAWVGTLVVQGLSLAISILQLVTSEQNPIIKLIFDIVVIAVLLQPNVKRAFNI